MISIVEKIKKLKKEKNAIILAHYYQREEIQDIADFIGDSLALSYKAAETDADIIIMAGVVFMAETAKLLSYDKKVLAPDLDARCSLSDYCPSKDFKEFIDKYPGHTVVTYVNTSAEVKALSDITCTSSNAVDIINSIPKSQPIIFAPDKNLGKYLIEKTGRPMKLWDGSCLIHESFSEKKILELKKQHLGSKIIAHPECAEVVIMIADFIGSTQQLLNFTKKDTATTYIIVTESGIIHQMKKLVPEKKFIPAPPSFYTQCNCGECPYMKVNTLEKIYNCLLQESPEILIPEDIFEKALKPIQRMMVVSNLSK